MTNTCEKCGSNQLIPRAEVVDHVKETQTDLQVRVDGAPFAMFYTDSEYGKLSARICGSCGFTELYVDNPFSLYRKYLQSRDDKVQ